MNTHRLFRRFTYLVSIAHADFPKKIKGLKSESMRSQLKKAGIGSVEAYVNEKACFLLFDVSHHMDSEALGKAMASACCEIDLPALLQQEMKGFSFESSPLERIYELEQKEIFSPREGQLKTDCGKRKRFVRTLLLQEDESSMAEYKRIHGIGQAWPEITANMKTVGVKDMEIYLSGSQAVMIMDTVPHFNLDEVGPLWQKLPREEEWQAYVAKFQRTSPDASIQEKWKDMTAI